MSSLHSYFSSYANEVVTHVHNYFIYYQALFCIVFSVVVFIIVRFNLRRFFHSAFSEELEDTDGVKNKKNKLRRKLKNKIYNGTNLIVLRACQKPILAITWIILFSLLFKFINPFISGLSGLSGLSGDLFFNLFRCAVIACFLWFGMLLSFGLRDYYVIEIKKRSGSKDVSGVHAIAKLSQILLILIAILFVLPIFDVNINGILTIGGVSTLVIGLASKDVLSNFLGGLMVFFDRPFTVGDWISSPDKKIEGTVENIGWRMTIIRGFDKRPIYVPNGLFSQIILVNPSRMTNRRIKKLIGVRYDDTEVLPEILQGIREMLAVHPEIDQSKTTLVNLVDFSKSSVDFMVYTFTKTTDWAKYQMIQDDVMLKCEQIVREKGGECAFPTTTLHAHKNISLDVSSSNK